jgi:hypothetical protein
MVTGNRPVVAFLVVFAVGLALVTPSETFAHWCSNIYQTYARIVVKPERDTIDIPTGQSGALKVRIRNNYPYTMEYILLRANPPGELSVTVSPTESEARNKTIFAGQEATFTLTITRTANGNDDVDVLNLEVNFRVQGISGWRDMSHKYVAQGPDPADIRWSIQNEPAQTRCLLNADLADVDGCPSCEADGVNDLMGMWGSINGDFENTSGHQFIRSGQALAIRLNFRNFNNPPRSDVVQSMVDGMNDFSFDIARGTAAFFSAYGGNDSSSRIQTMANSDSSTTAQRMAKAAQLILGEDTSADVNACLNDGSEQTRARMACAAALGIMGEDDPITDFLMPQSGDGTNYNYERVYGSYLLQLVVYSRRGGPEGVGVVSFLDEEVVVDDTPPAVPMGFTVQPL